MKRIVSLVSLALCLNSLVAQFTTEVLNTEITDTLRYAVTKNGTLISQSINTVNNTTSPAVDDGYNGYGQRFEAPDTVTLKGFCFYGLVYTGSADSLLVRLHQPDTSGALSNTAIDSVWIDVPFLPNFQGNLYSSATRICGEFSNPIRLIGDYVITLTNDGPSNIFIVRNSNGGQENLAYNHYVWASNNSFDGWYQVYSSFGTGWNFDVIIEPIVSYSVRTEHIIKSDVTCVGDTLTVESSISYEDSLLYNKMYNPNHSTYATTSNFLYHYGNGMAVSDTFRIYNSPGTFSNFFSGVTSMSGWTFFNYTSVLPNQLTINGIDIDLGGDTLLCNGSLILDAGNIYNNYSWSTNDTTSSITLEAASLTNGVNQVHVQANHQGCPVNDTINISIQNFEVAIQDFDTTSSTNDTTLICINTEELLFTNMSGSHLWNTGEITDTISIGPFATEGQIFNYIVEVENGGCSRSDSIYIRVDLCSSIDEEAENNEFLIYPNPVENNLTIEALNWTDYQVNIIDLNGRIILSKRVNSSVENLNLDYLDKGSYILNLTSDNKNIQRMIQIIK